MGHIVTMDMVCASLAFIDGLGGPEMVLIFVIILVLFGGQKLPEFARGFGKSIREFKKAAAGVEEEFKRALDDDERKQNARKLAAATPVAPIASSDSAGPDAGVHSPVTDDVTPDSSSAHDEPSSYDDGTSYDDGSHYADSHAASDEVPATGATGASESAAVPPPSDTPAEPKILPAAPPPAPAAPPPKAPTPPPANSISENPS